MKTINQILEEFEKEFGDWNFHHKDLPCFHDSVTEHAVKAFLKSSLESLLDEIPVEEEDIGCTSNACMRSEDFCTCDYTGYNRAIQEVKEAIKRLKE